MKHWQMRIVGCGILTLAVSGCGTTTGDGTAADAGPGTDALVGDATGTDAVASDAVADVPAGTDAAATEVADAQNDLGMKDVGGDLAADSTVPINCGGKTNVACPDGQYCAVSNGLCGGVGTCDVKEQICDTVYAPVCGCDGKTYGNSCEAAVHGVNVASTGACTVDNSCGGFVGKPCGKSQFCETNGCGADMMGVCVTIPTGCPKNLMPVCGCDGVTYGNECMRQVAGVSKASDGNCPIVNPSCTVGDNTTCGKSQFCQAPSSGLCDGKGSCATVPQFCPTIYQPVCGCDGNNYGSECEAHGSGTNVASSGTCATPPGCTTTKDCTGGLACKSGICGTCMGIMCTAIACPQGEVKDQCCQCYTP